MYVCTLYRQLHTVCSYVPRRRPGILSSGVMQPNYLDPYLAANPAEWKIFARSICDCRCANERAFEREVTTGRALIDGAATASRASVLSRKQAPRILSGLHKPRQRNTPWLCPCRRRSKKRTRDGWFGMGNEKIRARKGLGGGDSGFS